MAVNAIRQALGDDARQPRFIRTVHGFGYAFCGEALEWPTPGRIAGPPVLMGFLARRRVLSWGTLGALGVVMALGVWLLSRRAPAGPIRIASLTTDGGAKTCPQLSPNGERVAYSWAGPADDNWDIYVKAVGISTTPLRLTEHAGADWSPVWSPDGRQIAFARRADEHVSIFTVPSLGGQERKLIDVNGPSSVYRYLDPALSWSPDGKWLAFAESTSADEPARIVRLSLETAEKQALTSPPGRTLGDLQPAFSPTGTSMALCGRAQGCTPLATAMCGSRP